MHRVLVLTALCASALFAQSVEFDRDVKPILAKSCFMCHRTGAASGNLQLDTPEGIARVISPGNSAGSLIIHRVLGMDGKKRMPLVGPPLTDAQIAILRRWIDTKRHWAYVKPVRPTVPEVKRKDWVRNPIDAFVLAHLEKEGLQPSPEAAKETLVRRVYLDLIGLPPTPAEEDAFSKDTRPDAYERLVDSLLANPHFGERWTRPWLDLARYADTNGYEKDERRSIWKYRDWVIDAFNRDMPFDQFTIRQLAGDLLPHATTDDLIASGFNRNTLFNEEGGVDKDEAHWTVLVDRVSTTSTVWLGTTMGCALCHNHKYDPFTQKEFYQLLSFFNNSNTIDKPYGDTSHKLVEPKLDLPTPEQAARRDELQKEIDGLEARLKTETPALQAEQARWEEQVRKVEQSYRPLEVTDAQSKDGTRLVKQSDGSLLATGTNPDTDVYTIEVSVPKGLKKATALRLETLPDASLPRGGPGRDAYGNFSLTDLKVEALGKNGAATPVAVRKFKADNGNVKGPKSQANAPLWSVDASRDDVRLPRQLVLVLDKPLRSSRLRVTLVHASDFAGQGIGRFRLSATADRDPALLAQVPAKLRPVLHADAGQRSEKQSKDLADAFRGLAPSLKADRDHLEALRKQLDDLHIPSTLVMGDRPNPGRLCAQIRLRGSFTSIGDTVCAGVPAALNPWPKGAPVNRLGLAEWIVSKDNPLTARVRVNQIWEQFFGRGIVETSEDFGTQGDRPTHPLLLDWLATEFMNRGWDQKAIMRLIVTSATYRQDSRITPELRERDPYNKLLARGPRFRVEAEMVRDIVLSASGLLNLKIGGPSVFPYQPPGIWDLPYNNDKWVTSEGPDRYRRGLYTFIRRTAPPPSLLVFDAPSREVCTVRRVRTNTPLQALTALNDPAFFEAAQALAERVMSAAKSPQERAALAFRLCTSRRPKPSELSAIVQDYNRERASHGESMAWTMVSNVLLNLDETLTKE